MGKIRYEELLQTGHKTFIEAPLREQDSLLGNFIASIVDIYPFYFDFLNAYHVVVKSPYGDHKLGVINSEMRQRCGSMEEVVRILCHRHGIQIRTKKLNRLVKMFENNFRLDTPEEQATAALDRVGAQLKGDTFRAQRYFHENLRDLLGKQKFEHLYDVLPKLMSMLVLKDNEGSKILKNAEDANAASKFYDDYTHHSYVLIKHSDDAWIVSDAVPTQAKNARVMSINQMPDWMRAKLGMLKMTPVEQRIDGVGQHYKDGYFLVIGEPNE